METSRRGDVATWRRRDVTVTSLPALHCSKNCFQKLFVTPHRTCIQNKHHIRNLNTKNYIINIKSHGNERLARVKYECFRHSSGTSADISHNSHMGVRVTISKTFLQNTFINTFKSFTLSLKHICILYTF